MDLTKDSSEVQTGVDSNQKAISEALKAFWGGYDGNSSFMGHTADLGYNFQTEQGPRMYGGVESVAHVQHVEPLGKNQNGDYLFGYTVDLALQVPTPTGMVTTPVLKTINGKGNAAFSDDEFDGFVLDFDLNSQAVDLENELLALALPMVQQKGKVISYGDASFPDEMTAV